MEMMRYFWDTAISISPEDSKLDQAERFPICEPDPLEVLFRDIGLESVACRAIDIPMVFRNFDDYWTPFLGKQGAAPTYLASLDQPTREKIRGRIESAAGAIAGWNNLSESKSLGRPGNRLKLAANEQPVHEVHIARRFATNKYEITFDEYDEFAKATGRKLPDDEGWGRGRQPVIGAWNS